MFSLAGSGDSIRRIEESGLDLDRVRMAEKTAIDQLEMGKNRNTIVLNGDVNDIQVTRCIVAMIFR